MQHKVQIIYLLHTEREACRGAMRMVAGRVRMSKQGPMFRQRYRCPSLCSSEHLRGWARRGCRGWLLAVLPRNIAQQGVPASCQDFQQLQGLTNLIFRHRVQQSRQMAVLRMERDNSMPSLSKSQKSFRGLKIKPKYPKTRLLATKNPKSSNSEGQPLRGQKKS